MTYKEIIVKVLEDRNDWVPSYELEKVSTKYGWIGLRGTRDCRDLASKGVIDKKMIDGYINYRTSNLQKASAMAAQLPKDWGMIKGEDGVLFKF